jgi:hypothetical protein
MRIAAGILMIIASAMSIVVPSDLTSEVGLRVTDSTEAYVSFMLASNSLIVPLSLVLLVFIVGGGICALRKKVWWWALAGAIGCTILGVADATLSLLQIPPLYHDVAGAMGITFVGTIAMLAGILAIIFLIKRKGEFEVEEQEGV